MTLVSSGQSSGAAADLRRRPKVDQCSSVGWGERHGCIASARSLSTDKGASHSRMIAALTG